MSDEQSGRSTWGRSAFRAQRKRPSRTRRIILTILVGVLVAAVTLVITFTSGVQELEQAVLGVGAAVASLATVVALRVLQTELSFRERPLLENVIEQERGRRGSVAIPAALEKIDTEIRFSLRSKRYYRRVLQKRVEALMEGVVVDRQVQARLGAKVVAIGEPGTDFVDRLPERLTGRGVPAAEVVSVVDDLRDAHLGEQ